MTCTHFMFSYVLYKGAIASTGIYTISDWSFGIYEMECNGNESSIWDCRYQTNPSEGQDCSIDSVASVICMCKYLYQCST